MLAFVAIAGKGFCYRWIEYSSDGLNFRFKVAYCAIRKWRAAPPVFLMAIVLVAVRPISLKTCFVCLLG